MMAEINSYPHGMFCWADLGTPEAESAKIFYTSLLGLDLKEMPSGPDSLYIMLQKNGRDVAGLYEQKSDQRQEGIPPSWLAYMSVRSADESAKKIKSLGGRVHGEPFDVYDFGRMAVAQDPQGAVFAVWQPGTHIGAGIMGEPGTLCWNELMTTDSKGATDFYKSLFSFKAEKFPGATHDYTMLKIGDRSAGGIMKITPAMKGLQPHWLIYFAVSDCDGSVKKAKGAGAKVMKEPSDIPSVGRFAILMDPQEAAFGIIRLKY